MPRWIDCLDPEDLSQERALAAIEGVDPKARVKAFIRQEHRFYDLIDARTVEHATPADVLLRLPGPVRSPESIARRRAYTKEWWARNGKEYRRRLRERLLSQPEGPTGRAAAGGCITPARDHVGESLMDQ